jgi:6-phosphogluconolactonase (cycloisomerase 2 family)
VATVALLTLTVATIVAGAWLSGPTWPARAATAGAAVFVQTNDPAGNAIVTYDRHPDGKLVLATTYATGGKGGRESGAVADPLASQGSLVLDSAAGLLLAVNAGSDSVSVFSVAGDRLHLNQVVPSGGAFPVSIAVRGTLAYVLNAGLSGSVSGYTVGNGVLSPISGSTRSLGLANANPPFFLAAPAQVGFTPTGTQLVVTTKNNGLVEVFSVNPTGRLSDTATATAVGGVPFAFTFDQAGRLALVNAGSNSLGTYSITPDGSLTPVGTPVGDGQAAACWVTQTGGFAFVANAGSGTISAYRIGSDGTVSLVHATAAAGIPGAIDMATAGQVLYDQSGGSSSVAALRVNSDGSLSLMQSQAVPDGASQEGIVTT